MPANLERCCDNAPNTDKKSELGKSPCGYPECERSLEALDHYRDHKEDIGCCKGEKSSKD
jgi:hypothetical protein